MCFPFFQAGKLLLVLTMLVLLQLSMHCAAFSGSRSARPAHSVRHQHKACAGGLDACHRTRRSSPSTASAATQPSWPFKRVAEIPGNIIIGGLHMVHEREDQKVCGPVMPQGGLQAAEVMLYTIDKINEMGIMPQNVTLGAHILDDCDKDTYGLQQAVDFIKGVCASQYIS